MAATVDERIVEARFDSEQFEKGVNKTIKKLDELKDALTMKDLGKNVTDFAKHTSDGMGKVGESLEKLSNRITTFKGMVKQFIVSGIAEQVSNIFMSIERSIVSFVQSISSAQVGAGMNKYTEILNSVRTMTAAGVSEDIAYEKIKRLGKYSDQTSYSLNQMTSGMSKLVAAGIDVDKAEKSMEGLANMCASAGVNVYDAQRAFTNFAQAISSGSMQIKDWMSFENLNMATENVNKIFMEAAVQTKALTKTVDKNGKEVYKTSNKINKKIKANKEVTSQNLRNTLSYGWLDKDTMVYATAMLSYFEDLGKDMSELTDDELKEFSAKAYQAAKEARSFADVMGTVKDVVATGWATSFEHIFGKLEEATKFFTWLSESELANAIYKLGEFRNTVLAAWGEDVVSDEQGVFVKGATGRDKMLSALKNIDELIGNIHEGLENLFPSYYDETLRRTLTFPEILGKKLGYLSERFNQATHNMLNFFTEEKQELNENGERVWVRHLKPEYVERFRKIAEGIGSVFGIIGKTFNLFTSTISKVFYKLQPIFDAIGDAIGTLFEPLITLNNEGKLFSNIEHAVDNILTALKPVTDILPDLIRFLGEIGAFFIQNSIDVMTMNIELIADAIGLIIDLFGGTSSQKSKDGATIIEKWSNNLKEFTDACKEGLGHIKAFFKAIFDDIRRIFGLSDQVEGQEGGAFENLTNFFKTNEFVQKVKAWIQDLPNKILTGIKNLGKFTKKLWDKILEFLLGKKVSVYKPGTGQWVESEKRIKSGFSLWLDNTVKSIIDWVKTIPEKAKNLWNTIIDFIFGKEQTTTVVNADGTTKTITTRVKEGFSKWLSDTITTIGNWIRKDLPVHVHNIWQHIIEFFFGKTVTVTEFNPLTGKNDTKTVFVKSKFVEWVEGAVDWIKKNIWTPIKEFISAVWDTVIGFIFGKKEDGSKQDITVSKVDPDYGLKDSKSETALTGVKDWVEKALGWIKNNIWDNIVDFVKGLWNVIIGFIFGEDENGTNTKNIATETVNPASGKGDSKTTTVALGVRKWIKDALAYIKDTILPICLKIVRTAWKAILDWIFGAEAAPTSDQKPTVSTDKNEPKTKTLIESVSEWLEGATAKVQEWIDGMPDAIQTMWTHILNAIFGNGDDSSKDIIDSETEKNVEESENTVVGTAKEMIADLGERIGKVISELPTKIAAAVDFGTGLITQFLERATDFFNDEVAKKQLLEGTEGGVDALVDGISENATEGEKKNASAFITAIVSIGRTLRKLVLKTIPDFLLGAFNYIGTNAGDWISGFADNVPQKDFEIQVEKLGKKFSTALEALPGYIDNTVEAVKKLINRDSKSEYDELRKEITDQFTDESGNIIDKAGYDKAMTRLEQQMFRKYPPTKGLKSLISSLGSSLKNAFIELGPYILEGIEFGLGKIEEGFQWVTDVFENKENKEGSLGERLEEALIGKEENGEHTKLGASIVALGKRLHSLIVTTIPGFLSSAFSEISKSMPSILDGMFGFLDTLLEDDSNDELNKKVNDYNKTLEENIMLATMSGPSADNIMRSAAGEESDFEKSAHSFGDSLTGAIGNLKDMYGTVFTWLTDLNTGVMSASNKKLLLIVGLVFAFAKIIDNLTLLDEPGYVFKWAAIKTLVNGIFGFLTYLLALSATGNDEELGRVKEMFESIKQSITDFFQSLTDMVKGLMSLRLGIGFTSLLKTLTLYWGGALGGSGGFLKGILGLPLKMVGISVGIDASATMIGSAVDSMATDLTTAFERTEIGTGSVLEVINNLVAIGTDFDKAKEGISKIQDLLIEFVSVFLIKPGDKWEKILDPETYDLLKKNGPLDFMPLVESITDKINEVSGAIYLFKNAITTNTKIGENTSGVMDAMQTMMGMQSEMETFAQFADTEMFSNFKFALISIGTALQLFSVPQLADIDNITIDDSYIDKIIALFTGLFGTGKLKDLIIAVAGGETIGDKELIEKATSVASFAGALSLIAKACSGLTDDTSFEISYMIDALNTIDEKTLPDVNSITKKMGTLGNALEAFGKNIVGINDSSVTKITSVVDMLLDIGKAMKRLPPDSGVYKWIFGDQTIPTFGQNIQILGGNIEMFFSALNTDAVNNFSYSSLNKVMFALDGLMRVCEKLWSIGNAQVLKGTDWRAFEPLNDLPGFGTIITKFFHNMQTAFSDFKLEDVDFASANKAFDAVGKILGAIDLNDVLTAVYNSRHYFHDPKEAWQEVYQRISEALLGNGNGYIGIIGLMSEFYQAIAKVAKDNEMNAVDTEIIDTIIDSYMDLIDIYNKFFAIVKRENIKYDENEVVDPSKIFIPFMQGINDNIDTFTTFCNNAASFNTSGLEKFLKFSTALDYLIDSLFKSGEHPYDSYGELATTYVRQGVEELQLIDWTALYSIADHMREILKSDDFYDTSFSTGSNIDRGLADGIDQGTTIDALNKVKNKIVNLLANVLSNTEIDKANSAAALYNSMALYMKYMALYMSTFDRVIQNDSYINNFETFSSKINNLLSGINELQNVTVFSSVGEFFKELKDFFINVPLFDTDDYLDPIDKLKDKLIDFIDALNDKEPKHSDFFVSIRYILKMLINESNTVYTQLDELTNRLITLLYSINNFTTDAFDGEGRQDTAVLSSVTGFFSEVNDFLASMTSIDPVTNSINSRLNAIDELKNKLVELFGSISGFSVIRDAASMFGYINEIFRDTYVKDFSNFYDFGNDIGKNLDSGLAAGINQGAAISAAQALAGAIKGNFVVSWNIHSPSKVFEEIGQYLDLGLAQGIDSESDRPINAAEEMADESVSNIRSILEGIRDLAIEDMDITPTITPVVDMTNVNEAAQVIRAMGLGGLPFTFDTSGLNRNALSANPDSNREITVNTDYSGLINSIRGDLVTLGEQISDISNQFSGMRVVMDSGALVGSIINNIDSGLGRLEFYAGRT